MEERTPNKHETRTRETRELLLRAAEDIFARDGFEGAELGEIAALAGRTKGAIYAQFKSKEDIFLALIEQQTDRRRRDFHEMVSGNESVAGNLDALRRYCVQIAGDNRFALLLLEFKLYALRHPEARERLQRFMDLSITAEREQELTTLFGPAGEIPRMVAVHTLEPLLSALALEAAFRPQLLEPATLKVLAGRIFDMSLATK